MVKRVEGVYPSVEEALRAVERLRDEGYSRNNITLVANEDVRTRLSAEVEADVTTQKGDETRTDEDNKSFWESVKDAFTTDDSYDESNYDDPNYDAENDPVYDYRESISEGHVAVLVSGGPNLNDSTAQNDSNKRSDEESIELKEERLEIDKDKEKTGEVHVKKNVVEDTEFNCNLK